MPRPAWKRLGSPFGKTGARKTNPKYKRRMGEPWTPQEVRELKSLAKQNAPTGVLSLKLQRPPTAIRSKAQREGISLKPANRSPYNRRKRNARISRVAKTVSDPIRNDRGRNPAQNIRPGFLYRRP
jgi:hypothetical protein